MPKNHYVSLRRDGTGSVKVPTETNSGQNAARRYLAERDLTGPGDVFVWKRSNSPVAEKVHFKRPPKGSPGLLVTSPSKMVRAPAPRVRRSTSPRKATTSRSPKRASPSSRSSRSPSKSPKKSSVEYDFTVTSGGYREIVPVATLAPKNAARRFYGMIYQRNLPQTIGQVYRVQGHGFDVKYQLYDVVNGSLPQFREVA